MSLLSLTNHLTLIKSLIQWLEASEATNFRGLLKQVCIRFTDFLA